MDVEAVADRIEHTVLGPETTVADVERVLDEALEHGMRACVPPCYVAEADGYAPTVPLATVVAFPHGQNATAAKHEEAVVAWKDGADELDVVMNVGRLKAGETEAVAEELAEVVAAVPVPVKVIVEAPLLSAEELDAACEAAVEAGAAFLKTATGFSEGGATVADVERMAEHLPVKASGGVRTAADAEAMFGAGAERIGASSGAAIVEEFAGRE